MWVLFAFSHSIAHHILVHIHIIYCNDFFIPFLNIQWITEGRTQKVGESKCGGPSRAIGVEMGGEQVNWG